MNAGKRRTYFFDVRQTKGDDFYLTLTESTRRFDGDGYERHKIFLYKEDFNRFLSNLEEVVDYIKTELMPDYDYEEFDRRHDEWEAQEAEGGADRPPRVVHNQQKTGREVGENDDTLEKPIPPPTVEPTMDEDLSW
ncbi:MAG: PUR family DNA/RNA-binding protein [Bacteroidales bacterium]|nr:PUR family DNA/RNA-binding protein [Bacteroidales bacterium]